MIWLEMWIQIIENLRAFFDLFPDFDFTVPDYVLDALSFLYRSAEYFIPFAQLKPIFVMEFLLINFSIYVSGYKGLKDFVK